MEALGKRSLKAALGGGYEPRVLCDLVRFGLEHEPITNKVGGLVCGVAVVLAVAGC